MRVVIGNGTTTRMWLDPWIPEHPPRPPRALTGDLSNVPVSSFMNADRNSWNIMKLEAEVVPEDIDKILAIKLCSKAELDLLGWSYNEDGIYTVKSGYWLSTHLPDYDNGLPIYGDVNIKQRMWKTELPPKIKHFLWKLLSKALPTGSNLKRRHVTRDSLCKRCYLEEETEKHLFFDCPYAAQVWRASGINNLIINSTVTSLEEKIQTCLQITTSTRLSHFQDLAIWTLWRIWKSRNLLIFQHKNVTWSNVIQQAKNDANEWRTYSTMQIRQSSLRSQSSQVVKKSWSRPQTDWIKCNIDGSFINQDIPSTTGWILRDSNGVYKGAGQAMGNRIKNAFESELQSLIIAMQHCWSKGYKKVIFESDC